MKKSIWIFFASLILYTCTSAPRDDDWKALKVQLDLILEKDQADRILMDSIEQRFGWSSPEMQQLFQHMHEIDSANLVEVEAIIEKFGYPPTEKVGKSNDAIFFVIQHSPDSIMEKHYNLMIDAGEKGYLDKGTLALFQDRVLMNRGEPQLYGSQIRIETRKNAQGVEYDSVFVWKIKDPSGVNERRRSVGLGTLEEYVANFRIDPAIGYRLEYHQ